MAKQPGRMGQENPYRLHKQKRQQFSKSLCCGRAPGREGSEVYCYSVELGDWAWQPLYRCSVCGRYYLRLGDAFQEIENPLCWERREDCNFPSDMIP